MNESRYFNVLRQVADQPEQHNTIEQRQWDIDLAVIVNECCDELATQETALRDHKRFGHLMTNCMQTVQSLKDTLEDLPIDDDVLASQHVSVFLQYAAAMVNRLKHENLISNHEKNLLEQEFRIVDPEILPPRETIDDGPMDIDSNMITERARSLELIKAFSAQMEHIYDEIARAVHEFESIKDIKSVETLIKNMQEIAQEIRQSIGYIENTSYGTTDYNYVARLSYPALTNTLQFMQSQIERLTAQRAIDPETTERLRDTVKQIDKPFHLIEHQPKK